MVRFTKKLFKIVGNSDHVIAVACGIDLNAYYEIFPEDRKKDGTLNMSRPYAWCLQNLMNEIGHGSDEQPGWDQIAIIYERGPWNDVTQAAFDELKDSPYWQYRERFASITGLTGSKMRACKRLT